MDGPRTFGRHLVITLAFFGLSPVSVLGDVFYVSPTPAADADYSAAKPGGVKGLDSLIYARVTAKKSPSPTNEVVFADGTYVAHDGDGTISADSSIPAVLSLRYPENVQTRKIVVRSNSGDPAKCIFRSASDNLRWLVARGYEIEISGVTVDGFRAQGGSGAAAYLVGMKVEACAKVTFSNCRFLRNVATGASGGALYGPMRVVNCVFEENGAPDGEAAAIYLIHGEWGRYMSYVSNSVFRANYADTRRKGQGDFAVSSFYNEKGNLPETRTIPTVAGCVLEGSYSPCAGTPTGGRSLEYVVNPGDDLTALQQRIRAERNSDGSRVTVTFEDGVYSVKKGLVLTGKDQNITWRARHPGCVRLVGGDVLKGSDAKPLALDDPIRRRLRTSAAGLVLALDVPEGLHGYFMNSPAECVWTMVSGLSERFPEEYPREDEGASGYSAGCRFPVFAIDGHYLHPARWPNDGGFATAKAADIVMSGSSSASTVFRQPASGASAYDLTDANGYVWGFDGCAYRTQAKKILGREGENLTVASNSDIYFLQPGSRYQVRNVLEELDVPGEWCWDAGTRKLYFIPPEGFSGESVIELGHTLDHFFWIRTTGTRLEGLSFEAKNGLHAVCVEMSRDTEITGCNFSALATPAVFCSGRNTTVKSCDFADLTGAAVLVRGGLARTLDWCGNVVENCHVKNFDLHDDGWAIGGIHVHAQGARVSRCLIHGSVELGVYMAGVGNTLEYTRIFDCVTHHGDAGAFYSQCCSRTYGTVIRYNDITSPPGQTETIYYDDVSGGHTLCGNVLRNYGHYGVFFSGRDNVVSNNVIYGGTRGFFVATYGAVTSGNFAHYLSEAPTSWKDIKAFYDLSGGPLTKVYPSFARWGETLPYLFVPRGCRWENNLMLRRSGDAQGAGSEFDLAAAPAGTWVASNNWSCVVRGSPMSPASWSLGGIRFAFGTAEHPLDFGFVDLPNDRFAADNRIVYDIGDFNQCDLADIREKIPTWQPIPFDDIGLYRDAWRTTLPFAARPASFTVDAIDDVPLVGAAAEPHPVVRRKSDGAVLSEGVDYRLSWTDNTVPGVATLRVTGIGAYAEECETAVKSFNVGARAYYAKPDGFPDSDCLSWETAGTISNAFARLNAGGAGTVDNPRWVVLKTGTSESPEVYDLSSLAGTGIANYISFAKDFTGIRSETPDDPRGVVILGGGERGMRFANSSASVLGFVQGITFRNFRANGAGGVFYDGNSKLVFSCCSFENNLANGMGGAIYAPREIANCRFVGNVATNAVGGGAVYFAQSDKYIARDSAFVSNRLYSTTHACGGAGYYGTYSNCFFQANVAKTIAAGYQDDWGTICRGKAYDCEFRNQPACGSYLKAFRCLFVDGSIGVGMAGNSFFDACVFTNSAFGSSLLNNTATNCLIVGMDKGASTESIASGVFYNCTIMNNRSSSKNNAHGLAGAGSRFYNCILFNPDAGWELNSSGVVMYNSFHTKGKSSGIVGENNVEISSIDELGLLGYGPTPYAPAPGSPAIDAGMNVVSLLAARDIVGNPRLVGSRMDIGCYEYVPPSAQIEGEVDARPGVGYAGSTVTVSVAGLVTGVYSREAFHATFTVNGKTYAGEVTPVGADGCRVTFAVDAAGEYAVVAEHAYVGVLELWMEDEKNGRTELASRDITLVQGKVVRETHPWFREVVPNLGTDGTWEQVDDMLSVYTPSNAMPDGAAATVETSFVFKGQSEADDGPLPDNPQGAMRIVADGKGGSMLQVYAAVADANRVTAGWQNANVTESAGYEFVEGVSYAVRLEFDYPSGERNGMVPLVCSVKSADEPAFVKLFEGFAVTAQTGGACTASRVSRAGFLGEASFDSLTGEYAVMRIKADVGPTVDGVPVAVERVFEAARTTRPIAYPSAPVVTGEVGAQKIVFGGVTVAVPRHYTATVSGNTVVLTLNDFARPVISDGDGDKKAISVGETTVSLHISNAIEGLFYRVVSASTLGDEWTPVTEFLPVADFTVDRKAADVSAFYKIEVSDVQKEKK